MPAETIYLDNNATTPLAPEVAEAMHSCARCQHGNPASQHEPGRRARRLVENAREDIARLLGAKTSGMDADQVLFTSGATEANNLAIRGLAGQPPGRILVSAVEHPSVMGTCQWLGKLGFDVRILPVDTNGVVVDAALDSLLDNTTRLVSVMLGNHETGVLQPIAKIAERCHDAKVPLHTDAVQAAGKIPIRFRELGATMLSISAHKFHGPTGIGALVIRSDTTLEPITYGGFQQAGLRPGTESVEMAVGLQTALQHACNALPPRDQQLSELRQMFESELRRQIPGIVVHADQVARLPHTANVSFPGLDRQAIVMALDVAGVACSTGSACASGSSEPSPTLLAMGCPEELYSSAVRFSFGARNTPAEVTAAVRRILATINNLRRAKTAPNRAEPPRRPIEKPV